MFRLKPNTPSTNRTRIMIWQINAVSLLFSLVQPSTAADETMTELYIPFSSPNEEIRNSFSPTVKRKEDFSVNNLGKYLNQLMINVENDQFNATNTPLNTSSESQDFKITKSGDIHSVNGTVTYNNDQTTVTIPTDDVPQQLPNLNRDPDFPEIPRSPSSISQNFNMEGSEIGDAAFVVPDESEDIIPQLPAFVSPRRTYALSVNDGQVIHNDIRKDNGEYIFSYTSSDGSKRREAGRLVTELNGQKVLTVSGSYDYTAPDGQRFHVDYQADANGYRIINNKPVGNNNVFSWGKPTTGGRPVNTGKHPNIPLIGKPMVKPTFNIQGGRKPRPTQTSSLGTPLYVIYTTSIPITHKNKPSFSIVPLSTKPFNFRPTKIKQSKNKRPNSQIFPLSPKFPTQNTISPEEFIIDNYPFATHQR